MIIRALEFPGGFGYCRSRRSPRDTHLTLVISKSHGAQRRTDLTKKLNRHLIIHSPACRFLEQCHPSPHAAPVEPSFFRDNEAQRLRRPSVLTGGAQLSTGHRRYLKAGCEGYWDRWVGSSFVLALCLPQSSNVGWVRF